MKSKFYSKIIMKIVLSLLYCSRCRGQPAIHPSSSDDGNEAENKSREITPNKVDLGLRANHSVKSI